MTKIEKLSNKITNFSIQICTLILFTIKEEMHTQAPLWISTIVIFISTIIFKEIPNNVFSFFLRFKFIRKKACKHMYIEGYWFLQSKNTTTQFSHSGLAKFEYDSSSKGTRIIVYRLDEKNEIFTTTSEYVLPFGEHENGIVNFFSCAINDEKVDGISSGHFTQSTSDKPVDAYSGHIMMFHGSVIITQTGNRIKQTKIDCYKDEHGKEWKIAFLKDAANKS